MTNYLEDTGPYGQPEGVQATQFEAIGQYKPYREPSPELRERAVRMNDFVDWVNGRMLSARKPADRSLPAID